MVWLQTTNFGVVQSLPFSGYTGVRSPRPVRAGFRLEEHPVRKVAGSFACNLVLNHALSYNGVTVRPNTQTNSAILHARKDVMTLADGEEARVFMRFRDMRGRYVMHCHNVVHEDHAMMVRWDIV